jgi:hypothetical protein
MLMTEVAPLLGVRSRQRLEQIECEARAALRDGDSDVARAIREAEEE